MIKRLVINQTREVVDIHNDDTEEYILDEGQEFHVWIEGAQLGDKILDDGSLLYTVDGHPRRIARIVRGIKEEANRRILTRFPIWKQVNMTARGVELQDQWRANGTWTEQEAAEAAALKGAFAWVKAVRQASDALETTLPEDWTNDAHWPPMN